MLQRIPEDPEDLLPARRLKGGHRKLRAAALWGGGCAAALVLALVVGSYFIDEPLRQYMERTLNAQLQGYTVRLPGLDFHPFGFSISLEDLTISQNAHPDPPVAEIPRLHASVHWRALLHARLVADFLFTQPKVHINRPQLHHEAADKVPLKDEGWQAALESIYPLKINRFRIRDGDLTYIDDDPKRPLHVSRLNLVAENIRNVRAPERAYPSDIHLGGIIFDSGKLRVDGHANFLAAPYAGVDADLSLDHVELNYLKPILARMNLWVAAGTLWADGHVEYAPGTESVHLKKLAIRGVQLDYVHSAQTAAAEEARAAKVGHAAEKLSNAPVAAVRVDQLHISDSTVAYVDHSWDPGYRVYLANSDLMIKNLSNQGRDGPASVMFTGQLMGSGDSMVRATFEPVAKSPDLDVAVMIEGTQLRSLNDLLRTFGNFDVVAGQFAFYSELSIKNGEISGYLKPLLKGMQVYSRNQDAAKPVFHQLYEELVELLQSLLQNRRGEVGTTVDISGKVSNPETSTWQVVFGLIKNAFFKALQPGFESQADGASP